MGEGFGPEVKRRIMIGTYALSAGYYDAYYAQAQSTAHPHHGRLREGLRRLRRPDLADLSHGSLQDKASAWPTLWPCISPTSALSRSTSQRCPGISIPAGFSGGLPVGLQMIGPHFCERGLFDAAHAVEQSLKVDVVAPLDAGGPAPVAGAAS